jgi:transitional endoplasmic reticulum ATPase
VTVIAALVGCLEVPQIHTTKQKLAEGVDLDTWRRTQGLVGADLASLCTEAAMLCLREKLDLIDLDDEVIDTAVLGALRVTKDHFYAALRTAEPESNRDSQVDVPTIHRDDSGDLEAVKQELKETLECRLRWPESYARFDSSAGPSDVARGCWRRRWPRSAQRTFQSVKGPERRSKLLDESESNVRELFEKARRISRCIIFDELDWLAKASRERRPAPH